MKEETLNEDSLTSLLRSVITKLNAQSDVIDQLGKSFKKLQDSSKQGSVPPTVNNIVDTKPIEDLLKAGFLETKLHVVSQPRTVVKKYQLLLFPEQDARLFYKIVFSRWFMWVAIMFFCLHLYKWVVYREDIRKEIAINTANTNQILKAWDFLYSQNNKHLRRVMDSALAKTRHNPE